jgi:hypothetical protein
MIRATTSRIKHTNARIFAIQAASPTIPPVPSTGATTATTKKIRRSSRQRASRSPGSVSGKSVSPACWPDRLQAVDAFGGVGAQLVLARAFKGILKLVEAQGTSRAQHVRQIPGLIFRHSMERFPGWMGKGRGESRPSTDATEQVSLSSLVIPNPACVAVRLPEEPDLPRCWTSRKRYGIWG